MKQLAQKIQNVCNQYLGEEGDNIEADGDDVCHVRFRTFSCSIVQSHVITVSHFLCRASYQCTVMDTDPGILCFQHCSSKVFCFELPDKCPLCSSHLSTAHFRLLPFRYTFKYYSEICL
jgi:hypothetical protein